MVDAKDLVYCDPAICHHCMYVGEGTFLCEAIQEIVIDDWIATESFMSSECPMVKKRKAQRKGMK